MITPDAIPPQPSLPVFDDETAAAAQRLIALALAEDLGERGDVTCQTVVDPLATATVQVRARQAGVLSGGPVAAAAYQQLDARVDYRPELADGEKLSTGTLVATIRGPLRSLLTGERTALNFLTHLSGVATLTRNYVDAVMGTSAKVLDTRKTHAGFRLLEKYAVRCGGGTNHRIGLFDGCMLKDNHLAGWLAENPRSTLADMVRDTRNRLQTLCEQHGVESIPIQVEVDTLGQLAEVLPGQPDAILLDNMTPQQISEAISLRNRLAPATQLEASGGITLATIREFAETGVERISVGALTHSAVAVDVGLDWSTATN